MIIANSYKTPERTDSLLGIVGEAGGYRRMLLSEVVDLANTGTVVLSPYGANDQTALQAAITGLGATGGTLRLGPGRFVLSYSGTYTGDSFNIPYAVLVDADSGPLVIEGAGMGATVLTLADSQPTQTTLLHVRGDSTGKRTNPTVLRNLTLDGNAANQPAWADFGILTSGYADNITLDGVEIRDYPKFGVHLLRNSQKAAAFGCFVDTRSRTDTGLRIEAPGAKIALCDFLGDTTSQINSLLLAANADISVYADNSTVVGNVFVGGRPLTLGAVNECTVVGNTFRDVLNTSGWALTVEPYAFGSRDALYNVIQGNTFKNVRQGIQLAAQSSFAAKYTKVLDNQIIEGPGISLANGIVENGAADFNEIIGNTIFGATTAITKVGTNTWVRRNRGYVTEASGTATVANGATTVAVTHGLAAAPTRVFLTPTGLGNAASYWVTSPGATTFTITVNADPGASTATFSWWAQVGEG